MEESGQRVRLNRIIDLQSDHWIGRSPTGVLEDFHALRIIYSATSENPTDPYRHRRRWHHPVSPVDTAVALASAVLGSRDTHVS